MEGELALCGWLIDSLGQCAAFRMADPVLELSDWCGDAFRKTMEGTVHCTKSTAQYTELNNQALMLLRLQLLLVLTSPWSPVAPPWPRQ